MKQSLTSLFEREASEQRPSDAEPSVLTKRRSQKYLILKLQKENEGLKNKIASLESEKTDEKEILQGLNSEMEAQLSIYKNEVSSLNANLASFREKAFDLSRKNSELQIEVYEMHIERDRIRQLSASKKQSLDAYAEKLDR